MGGPSKKGILGTILLLIIVLSLPAAAVAQSAEDAHIVPRKPSIEAKVAGEPSSPELRPRPMRVDVDLVLIPVTVTDTYGRPVTTLEKKDFALFEGDSQQQIRYFSTEDAPISVGLILDFSGSMKNKVEYEREAVEKFLESANPEDEYFAITVSSKPKVVASSTNSLGTLQERLSSVTPQGGTALFDAIYLGLEKLRSAHYKRKALLLVSDGGDNRSRYTLKEIKSMVAEGDVITYAIGLFDDVPVPLFKTFEERWGRKWLGNITDVSGGRTIAADNRRQIPQIAGLISRELRNQYVIGYRPDNSAHDGKWRRVTVRTMPAEQRASFSVHSREGYFAPEQ